MIIIDWYIVNTCSIYILGNSNWIRLNYKNEVSHFLVFLSKYSMSIAKDESPENIDGLQLGITIFIT